MNNNLWILVLISVSEGVVYPVIPAALLACYRDGGGGGARGAGGPPRRLDVLLDLLRTAEADSQLDMRMFSAALLASSRLDGIEEAANSIETATVTPYRATAFQFYKYKLLMDMFIPSQSMLTLDALSLREKCLLHRMLSSTVMSWERGDESVVCPLSAELQRVTSGSTSNGNANRRRSRCPIEEGVVATAWGAVAAGALVAAVAAALEPQRVAVADVVNADAFKAGLAEPLNAAALDDFEPNIETLNATRRSPQTVADVSNVWAATLAGDLAEVAVAQGPRAGAAPQRLAVGAGARWNDTLLPRAAYMLLRNTSAVDWQITDAEILAGIDGLILAQHVPAWVAERASLRLSQVLGMYYSEAGPAFAPSVRACDRAALAAGALDAARLRAETAALARALTLQRPAVYVPREEMDSIAAAAVEAFMDYVPIVLKAAHRPCRDSGTAGAAGGAGGAEAPAQLLVVTDGAWPAYEVQQFMSWLGGAAAPGARGSLALLHGNTGRWVAPPARNLSALFAHIDNFTDPYPNRLNFPNVLSTILLHAQNQTLAEAASRASAAPASAVLVLSPGDKLSPSDVKLSRDIMQLLRTSYFDIVFAYVGQDLIGYENINNGFMDYSELFVKTESSSVQDVIDAIQTEVIGVSLAQRIIGPLCPVNGTVYTQIPYEDYVLPGKENRYRIHPYYLQSQASVTVTFHNGGQGQLQVCWWRGAETSHNCHTLDPRQDHSVNLTAPCPSIDFCLPAHFSVTALSTLNLCANNDCQLPQQVGYYIDHSGLRCLALRGAASHQPTPCYLLFVIFIMHLFDVGS